MVREKPPETMKRTPFTETPVPRTQRVASMDRKRQLDDSDDGSSTAPPSKIRPEEVTDDESKDTEPETTASDDFQTQGRKKRNKQTKTTATSQPLKEKTTSAPQSTAPPKILVPPTEGFASPVDVAEAIDSLISTPQKLPMKFLESGQVLLSPPDMDTYNIVMSLREINGIPLQLRTASHGITRGVLLRYPLLMPLSPILKHPQVATAVRCTTRQGEPTRQVEITTRGPLPGSLELGNWGTFYTRPYSREPLRCFKCQKFGHHRANCTLPPKCGVCAGSHETEECITKHKQGQTTTTRCPNCKEAHHAWNRSCTARRELVEVQKRTQQKWMVSHRPALAATSTWGDRTTQQQTQNLSSNDFPALGQAAARPRTGSRPRQRLATPPPKALNQKHNPTPTPTASQSTDQITISRNDLKDMFQTFAAAIVSMLGKEVDKKALNTMTEDVVRKLSPKTPASTRQARSPSPRTRQPTTTVAAQAHQPRPMLPPGTTPATAAIESEKRALGLQTTTSRKPRQTRSASCNGTSTVHGASTTN